MRGSGRFLSISSRRWPDSGFQSPSLRGSGRFAPLTARSRCRTCMFQSPSLRGSGRFFPQPAQRQRRQSSFNPLHCGAVVASLLGRGDVAAGAPSFNPLHCGAVVASHDVAGGPRPIQIVSIPFIAGQWSLRSPPISPTGTRSVSIPFIAGQWSLPPQHRSE